MYTERMPPETHFHDQNEDRLLPKPKKPSSGPLVGIIIIVLVMLAGALYFLNVRLAQQKRSTDQLPLILPGTIVEDSTTTPQ